MPASALQAAIFTRRASSDQLVERGTRPVLAGVFFGLLTFKPFRGGAAFALLALLALRAWRVIAITVVTGLTFFALSVAVFGPDAWIKYLTATGAIQTSLLEYFMAIGFSMAGLLCAAQAPDSRIKLHFAVLFFVFAVYTKQTSVAAPLAAVLITSRADGFRMIAAGLALGLAALGFAMLLTEGSSSAISSLTTSIATV